ncbi:hypothetical protein PAXINDRAFT_69511 [Paxillus involutus ATCC 200175]|nr:hypothetical protein PAXINDRAFT_69511 [Paxillus involutus ATCC 200175]
MNSSLEIMVPHFQGVDDGEEFSIVDVVVPFGRREHFRQIDAGVKFAVDIFLHEDASSSMERGISHNKERF